MFQMDLTFSQPPPPAPVEPFQPRIYQSTPDVVTVEMDKGVRVDVNVNKSVRLYTRDGIDVSCSRFGDQHVLAIRHPDFGYIQTTGDGTQLFAKLPAGHIVIGDVKKFRLFKPGTDAPEGVWLISESGVELPADPSVADYPQIRPLSYQEEFDLFEGQRQRDGATVTRHPTGVEVKLKGISIWQYERTGEIWVYDDIKSVLNINVNTGEVVVDNGGSADTDPTVVMSISPRGQAKVNLPGRMLSATPHYTEVSVGLLKAKFDAQLHPSVQRLSQPESF